MAIISLPASFPLKAVTWTLYRPGQANVSAWTGKRTVVTNPWHGKWSAKVDLATIQGEAAFRPLRAFFASLKGTTNTFQLPATEGAQHAGGDPTTSASVAQGATTMTLTGAAALTAGMYATIPLPSGAAQLVILTADISAGVITFEPPLREAIGSAYGIETVNPYALMALTDSSFSWDIGSWRRYGLSFSCDEAF